LYILKIYKEKNIKNEQWNAINWARVLTHSISLNLPLYKKTTSFLPPPSKPAIASNMNLDKLREWASDQNTIRKTCTKYGNNNMKKIKKSANDGTIRSRCTKYGPYRCPIEFCDMVFTTSQKYANHVKWSHHKNGKKLNWNSHHSGCSSQRSKNQIRATNNYYVFAMFIFSEPR
jgi:uncharacterized C2H2 Zn-finger protein